MPSTGVTGQGGSATWNCGHNGGPGVDGGMQYGAACPGIGGNVNYLSAPGGTSGIPANFGMPPSYTSDANMPSGGVGSEVGGSNDVNTLPANMNIASTAGANVPGGGFGLPDDHIPLAGGVPVLPDVSTYL